MGDRIDLAPGVVRGEELVGGPHLEEGAVARVVGVAGLAGGVGADRAVPVRGGRDDAEGGPGSLVVSATRAVGGVGVAAPRQGSHVQPAAQLRAYGRAQRVPQGDVLVGGLPVVPAAHVRPQLLPQVVHGFAQAPQQQIVARRCRLRSEAAVGGPQPADHPTQGHPADDLSRLGWNHQALHAGLQAALPGDVDAGRHGARLQAEVPAQ